MKAVNSSMGPVEWALLIALSVLWGAFFGMGFLNNMIPFSLIVWGQTHIASGFASILNATTPFFTVIAAHYLTSDERMTAGRLAATNTGHPNEYAQTNTANEYGTPTNEYGTPKQLSGANEYGTPKQLSGNDAWSVVEHR